MRVQIKYGDHSHFYKDVYDVISLVDNLQKPGVSEIVVLDFMNEPTNLVLRKDGTYKISSGLASYPKET